MNNFYIDKLTIAGDNRTTSTINFSQGLNIICGPSNTGKTYIIKCIDYLFGSDDNPIDISTGYNCITLYLTTPSGKISLERKLDTKKIIVNSANSMIESGEYTSNLVAKKYDKSITSVWLKLIGIIDQTYIMSSESCKKQTLSWRTFVHTFLLTEHKIISDNSILLPVSPTANTAAIASLLFLITGNDYGEMDIQEDKKIKEAKKKAVINYINKELSQLTDRNYELTEQLSSENKIDFNDVITHMMAEIAFTEQEISLAIESNQKILQELADNNEQLSECTILHSRYEELKTQYHSDLKRLNFIVDGEANGSQLTIKTCPFCEGTIANINNTNTHYIEASKSEYKKLNLQLKDLLLAIKAIETEKSEFEESNRVLYNKKNHIEQVVTLQLTPKVQSLKDKLSQYKQSIEIHKEIGLIKEFCISKTADLNEVEITEKSSLKFKVKSFLDRGILDNIDRSLFALIEECNYENLLTARMNISEMDIVVNGQNKRTFGKGYCAFFNVIVSTVFARYIKEKGKYSPSLLVFDSPILSLIENSESVSDNMKSLLFNNFIKNPGNLQIIIVENKIPDLDYHDSNIIRFTKNCNEGRYGLLLDVKQ